MLAEGRGVLVPFAAPAAIAAAVVALLDNEPECHAMRKRAYLLGRGMTWPAVADRYLETFVACREGQARHPRRALVRGRLDKWPAELPEVDLHHLRRLTDDTGIVQHAVFTVPNYREGYTTDDNARALVLAVLLGETEGNGAIHELAARYLAFLSYAFNPERGRFRNLLAYDRRWLEEVGSDDSHGRALWGLGTVTGLAADPGSRSLAGQLFTLGLPGVLGCTSPRAWAFALFGLDEYLRRFGGDRAARSAREELGGRLLELYRRHSTPDWPWFEDVLTYCNAALPHALLVTGTGLGRVDLTQAALTALEWLVAVQRVEEGHYVPIGSAGLYRWGGVRPRFDQQPVEAHATVAACLAALRLTGEERWRSEARRAFEWFLGRNDLGLSLYDRSTGGCRDGLHPDRANENQGAESTLAFLLALVSITPDFATYSTRRHDASATPLSSARPGAWR